MASRSTRSKHAKPKPLSIDTELICLRSARDVKDAFDGVDAKATLAPLSYEAVCVSAPPLPSTSTTSTS